MEQRMDWTSYSDFCRMPTNSSHLLSNGQGMRLIRGGVHLGGESETKEETLRYSRGRGLCFTQRIKCTCPRGHLSECQCFQRTLDCAPQHPGSATRLQVHPGSFWQREKHNATQRQQSKVQMLLKPHVIFTSQQKKS
ncbi:oral cancer overexpressed 1, transcript variant X6 [Columba livia]|uniref:Oral cancer overexpressed 1, transcript variant X6 n=1 Tax=Columba livia TaxID=8932 RepID=A0A2I0MI35_COLLI|nr:oral cancer overexpressed 1, transcript variant X6 [Columba livia]